MAVKAESFLVLEDSLAKRLWKSIESHIRPVLKQIVAAVNEGDFYLADRLVHEIDFRPAVEKQKKYIDLVGVSSALYGASQLAPVKETGFAKKSKPEEVRQARRLLVDMLAEEGTRVARLAASKAIAAEEARLKDHAFKADTFITGLPQLVNRAGKSMVDLGASLHTSRLSSWGFMVEAEVRGQQFYTINEQLDGRTCPVCRVMNGKVFPVSSAREKLENHLSITDPNTLKSVASWPKQDPVSVAALSGMTTAQLIARGWDTPPFHPMCRGLTSATTAKLAPEDFNRNQESVDDSRFVAGLLASAAARGTEAAVTGTDTSTVIAGSTVAAAAEGENLN